MYKGHALNVISDDSTSHTGCTQSDNNSDKYKTESAFTPANNYMEGVSNQWKNN